MKELDAIFGYIFNTHRVWLAPEPEDHGNSDTEIVSSIRIFTNLLGLMGFTPE